jgi:hypothetical protein
LQCSQHLSVPEPGPPYGFIMNSLIYRRKVAPPICCKSVASVAFMITSWHSPDGATKRCGRHDVFICELALCKTNMMAGVCLFWRSLSDDRVRPMWGAKNILIMSAPDVKSHKINRWGFLHLFIYHPVTFDSLTYVNIRCCLK